MKNKQSIAIISAAIFAAVAIIHFLRIVNGIDFSIGGETISIWVNVFGVVLAGTLSYLNFRSIEIKNKATWVRFFAWLVVIDSLIVFYSWAEGFSYWGISVAAFGWITVFDIILAAVLFSWAKNLSQRA